MPAGAKVLPYRSSIRKIDDFSFERIDTTYGERAPAVRASTGHAVVAGENYGQGSSREHAAIAPRNLGLRIVLVKSFARIHNYGVLPLVFAAPEDYDRLEKDDVLSAWRLRRSLESGEDITLEAGSKSAVFTRHDLTQKQIEVILAGSLINWQRNKLETAP